MQNSHQLLMIKPIQFGFNVQTAVNNSFQKDLGGDLQQMALEEFNNFVDLLRKNKIDVTIVEDTLDPSTPDSIFPNNWISFHADGSIILYPMFAINRRQERKVTVLETIKAKFQVSQIIDISNSEYKNMFLEGTGSMVLDRENKIAYACLSPRTDENLLNEFCSLVEYKAVTFNSVNEAGIDIYHTNVMMCVANSYVVVCLESIPNAAEKLLLIQALDRTNKEIIDISLQQLNSFAGNMLQVINSDGELLLVMSTQAYESLTEVQIASLQRYNRILHSSLHHIETAGGGSARCMMAEVFLQAK